MSNLEISAIAGVIFIIEKKITPSVSLKYRDLLEKFAEKYFMLYESLLNREQYWAILIGHT